MPKLCMRTGNNHASSLVLYIQYNLFVDLIYENRISTDCSRLNQRMRDIYILVLLDCEVIQEASVT